MKINCVYFDDEMSLVQEVKQTRDQLASRGIELANMNYGFIIRNKDVVDLPDQWDDIMESVDCEDIIWTKFGYDGTIFLIGISYIK